MEEKEARPSLAGLEIGRQKKLAVNLRAVGGGEDDLLGFNQ